MKASVWVAAACIAFAGIAAGSSCSSEGPALVPVDDAGTTGPVCPSGEGGPSGPASCVGATPGSWFWTEISAGQGANTAWYPSPVVDTANGKLLVVAMEFHATLQGPETKPVLFRCNLDGSSCPYSDLSAGRAHNGWSPSAVIDAVNRKLLVVTSDESIDYSSKPALFRCNLDGSSCAYTDISGGYGVGSGHYAGRSPSAVIDTANGKLLVVTADYLGNVADAAVFGDRTSLYRCNLDGSSCTHTDISAGHWNTEDSSSAAIDAVNGKLLVVKEEISTHKPALLRCELDGTSCTYSDISAGKESSVSQRLSPAIDPVNGKLLVVTTTKLGAALFRCDLDGSSCTYREISAGHVNDVVGPSAVVDAVHGKLLVVTAEPTIGWSGCAKPALHRCNLDGSSCVYTDMSAGRKELGQFGPSAVLDPVSHKLLVVAGKRDRLPPLSLFAECP